MSGFAAGIDFAPFAPWWVLALLGLAVVAVAGAAVWVRAPGWPWRLAAAVVLLAVLANPTVVIEDREPLTDIALAVLDTSPSQRLGDRAGQRDRALAELEEAVGRIPGLELEVVRAGESEGRDGTTLVEPLEQAIAEIPPGRFAGAFVITDGQVHDVPESGAPKGPLHVLLTGGPEEGDRRLSVDSAPSYGLIGKTLEMTLRVEDSPQAGIDRARVEITRDGEPWRTVMVPVGRPHSVPFEVEHAGTSYFELQVEEGPAELTLDNNRAVVAVNGVRDRLRVLLVSGEPHPGERAWRNLLKSDPAVDLVHFTILRPPEKQDRTPVNELSLISFPVRELFEVQLEEFDLVIFDRYRRRGVILNQYLANIADYVDAGGALLVAVGPDFGSTLSIYRTPLGPVLPGVPTGGVIEEGYRPALSELGRRHPVTTLLPGSGDPSWGRWFRQIEVEQRRGDTVMQGVRGQPLVILDRRGEGRVAQILSDQIWLWGRGFEGGGPQAELMRRVAHWLMKEPELEEDALRAEVRGDRIRIERRSLEPEDSPVQVTAPSGDTVTVPLEDAGDGRSVGQLAIEELGLYRVSDPEHSTIVAAGPLNPRELADVRATDTRLAPLVERAGGSLTWLGEAGLPDLRRVNPGQEVAGRVTDAGAGWVGLRANDDYAVSGIDEVPLLPALVVLLLGLGALLFAWRREGR